MQDTVNRLHAEWAKEKQSRIAPRDRAVRLNRMLRSRLTATRLARRLSTTPAQGGK